ncbi:MAG: efflux RND transporter periplasmic adaptor subunit, partial [Anaerolineaceae bacterium]|nr:efflux RND transporter periplasmic adaptor subunit [Anaerolineaceae bacterium]
MNANANLQRDGAYQMVLDVRLIELEARAALDDFDEDAYEDDLDDAKVKVNEAKEDLDDAEDDLQDYKDLDKDNATRKRYEDDVEDAEEDYHEAIREREELEVLYEQVKLDFSAAENNLIHAEEEYLKHLDGPERDAYALLKGRRKAAEAQIIALQASLDNLEIRAPFSGTVVDVNCSVGEFVQVGKPVFRLADFSAWYIETDDMTEMEVVKVAEGQSVIARPEALAGEAINGVVESISDYSEIRQGDVTYEARILLEPFDLPLRWGMSFVVTFE